MELGRKEDVKIELKNVGPFYTNRFPSVGQYMPQQFQEEAGIKKNIATCKAAIQELEVKMRMYLTA